jgi:hypothetical protein
MTIHPQALSKVVTSLREAGLDSLARLVDVSTRVRRALDSTPPHNSAPSSEAARMASAASAQLTPDADRRALDELEALGRRWMEEARAGRVHTDEEIARDVALWIKNIAGSRPG